MGLNYHKPSKHQRDALVRMADRDGLLYRWIGGYWATEAPTEPTSIIAHGVWHAGATTMMALERRGWVRRANLFAEEWKDTRMITDAGRAAIGRAP